MEKSSGPTCESATRRVFHSTPVWSGTAAEFLLVWSDNREGSYRVYGQRISADGELRDDAQGLTGVTLNAESPSLAEGQNGLGLAFTLTSGRAVPTGRSARARPRPSESPSELVILGPTDSVMPVIAFSRDRYVVVWEKRTDVPGDAIWGATLSENGEVLEPERRLTTGSRFARSPTVLPLGDRVLLIWSQVSGRPFQAVQQDVIRDLEELSPAIPIETGSGDSLYPSAAFGPNGDVGVIFGDNQGGDWQVYFARLVCGAGR